MSLSLTTTEVKAIYATKVLAKYTDDTAGTTCNDTILTACINKARQKLGSYINLETTALEDTAILDYGEDRLKYWWIDLTYYYCTSRVEKENIGKDKLEQVIQEIQDYQQNVLEFVVETDGYVSYADDFFLDEDDVEDWI